MAGRIQPITRHESAEELYARYRSERDVRRRQRLRVLWLVCTGHTASPAAEASGMGLRNVTRWLTRFRQPWPTMRSAR